MPLYLYMDRRFLQFRCVDTHMETLPHCPELGFGRRLWLSLGVIYAESLFWALDHRPFMSSRGPLPPRDLQRDTIFQLRDRASGMGFWTEAELIAS